MIKKIKSYLLVAMMSVSMGVIPAAVVPAMASAAGPCGSHIADQVSIGAHGASSPGASGTDCDATGVDQGGITKLAQKIVDLISVAVGAVAIIMIIIGGFRYITSGGDSGKVGNAKNSLVYAIVGLIIVALAQLIVRFVLNQSSNITGGAS